MTASLGLLAGLLQAAGYLLYARHAMSGATRPNAASWLMFAYGTGLVVVVEAAVGGTWPVLLLPAVCAVSSVGIAVMSLQDRGAWRLDRTDALAFGLDVLLTLAYALSWAAHASGALGADRLHAAATMVLVGTVAASITSFVPILRSTRADPSREQTGPWVVWSLSYGLLFAVSAQAGEPALLLYPGVCIVLHLLMAVLTLRRRRPPQCAPPHSETAPTSRESGAL